MIKKQLTDELLQERSRVQLTAKAGSGLLERYTALLQEKELLRKSQTEYEELLHRHDVLVDELRGLGFGVAAPSADGGGGPPKDSPTNYILQRLSPRIGHAKSHSFMARTYDDLTMDLEERLTEESKERRSLQLQCAKLQAEREKLEVETERFRENACVLRAELESRTLPRPRRSSASSSGTAHRQSNGGEAERMEEVLDQIEQLQEENQQLEQDLVSCTLRCAVLEEELTDAQQERESYDEEVNVLRAQTVEWQHMLDEAVKQAHPEGPSPSKKQMQPRRGSDTEEDLHDVYEGCDVSDTPRSAIGPWVDDPPRQEGMEQRQAGSTHTDPEMLCECPFFCVRVCCFSVNAAAAREPQV